MWRLTFKEVAVHRLRYALTALAVLLGVSFMAGTLVLTDTIRTTFDGLFTQIYHSTDAIVRGTEAFAPGSTFASQRTLIDASLADTVRAVPGVKAVALGISGYAQLVGRDGKPIGVASNGPPTIGVAWTDVAALNPLRLLPGGHPPQSNTQIVIDKHSADVGHFSVGDHVVVLSKLAPATFLISGIARWGSVDSPLGASITAFDVATAARVLGVPGKVDSINVQAVPGISQAELVTRIRAAIHDPRVEVVSGETVTKEGQDTVHQALGFFDTFLLAFALISLFVGSFLIFNTFSIVVAQRKRELALLRAVGASRRQVSLSVLGESLVIGFAASVAGLFCGIGLALLLKAGLAALGIDIPAAGLVVSTRTVVAALVIGTGITVASAVLPARRASRVPPVAAMQDVAVEPHEVSRTRVASGALCTAAGAAMLFAGLFTNASNRVGFVGAGAALVFVGVAILGPLFARPGARLLGAPLQWRGATGRLAQENAMRNPSRTSSTAAALMVGVALVSLMMVVASSTKSSVNSVISSAFRADFVITTGALPGAANGLSPQLEKTLSDLPEVAVATGVRAGVAQIEGATTTVIATDTSKIGSLIDVGVTDGSLASMTPTGIAVSTTAAADHHLAIGSRVLVTYPTTGTRAYEVQVIYKDRTIAGDYVLPLAAAEANFARSLDFQIYVKLAHGVPIAAGRHAVDAVLAAYPTASLQDQAQYKAQQSQQINALLNLVYALLALAIIIALIGIANTLALSIHERTRELGLLRAVGMTRSQLRSTVRYESVIISLFGALQGLVVGVLFGWAIVTALRSQGITTLTVPVGQLVVVAVLAGMAGVVAAIGPSRRAAKLDVLRAITTE